ncbi:hypothetical protein Emtol_3981 [Sporocytophaga myxococcoides]|uniref:Lipocalin-like domain-containing protein n=1 Tax=Sporocytophaga myxococcoides TaxID=153721 RepID=A0A098L996_9BACT|nr:lipocalin family protein [Sporocytophaga myxococcoides]GAL83471.1 hypothetical protein Emtol_3981 [Sporocytophaga myxococcoides]
MRKVIYLFALLVVFSSCKKDKENPTPASNEDLIAGTTSKTWGITKVTQAGQIKTMPDCFYDNIVIFNKNLVYQEIENTKCDEEEDKDLYTGSWNLSTDKKVININSDGDAYSFTILKLTETELVVSTMAGAALIEITFTKKS